MEAATPVDAPPLLGRVDLRRAGRIGGAEVDQAAAAESTGPNSVSLAGRSTYTPPIGLRLVEEVAAVPVPQLGRLALDDRAGPVVGLVVEALGHGRGHAGGLHRQELDEPEVGDVLLRLVELDAERVGARVREVRAGAHVLVLQRNGLVPSYGATGVAAEAVAARVRERQSAANAIACARMDFPRSCLEPPLNRPAYTRRGSWVKRSVPRSCATITTGEAPPQTPGRRAHVRARRVGVRRDGRARPGTPPPRARRRARPCAPTCACARRAPSPPPRQRSFRASRSRAPQRGVLWTHNDSGDVPRLFAVNTRGRVLSQVAVAGAAATDWEDVAAAPNAIYVADIGDNGAQRPGVVVYRVAEPRVKGRPAVTVSAGAPADVPGRRPRRGGAARVPDQRRRSWSRRTSAAGRACIRRAAARGRCGRVARIALGGGEAVTAGDVSADGRTIVVRSYFNVYVWKRRRGRRSPTPCAASRARRAPTSSTREGQGEALALRGTAGLLHRPGGLQPPIRRYSPR